VNVYFAVAASATGLTRRSASATSASKSCTMDGGKKKRGWTRVQQRQSRREGRKTKQPEAKLSQCARA
jgi:hypothetical protein